MARFVWSLFRGTTYHDGEGETAGAKCLISLHQGSGNGERWMPMLSPLLLFIQSGPPAMGCCHHVQGRLSLFYPLIQMILLRLAQRFVTEVVIDPIKLKNQC